MAMHTIHFETIDSTNTYAKQHCQEFPLNEITCITAEEQTAGYGKYKRKWISPWGTNICATFHFTLPLNTLHISSLAQLLAYSFASLLQEDDLSPKIKWPNDIQLKTKKLSGVLCETLFTKTHVHIFLGIGINVNTPDLSFIDQPATSLFLETGKLWDRNVLLSRLQNRFTEHLDTFKQSGFSTFHPLFESLLAFKNQTICCFDGKKEWVGLCHSITPDGRLNLLLPDNTLHTVISGDLDR